LLNVLDVLDGVEGGLLVTACVGLTIAGVNDVAFPTCDDGGEHTPPSETEASNGYESSGHNGKQAQFVGGEKPLLKPP
jgi:hypothetical protein